jgi:hypothetical protein
MNTVKCGSCNGTKKLLCLGNLRKDCPYCNGVGHIEAKASSLLDMVETKEYVSPFKVVNEEIKPHTVAVTTSELKNDTLTIESPVKVKKKPGRKPYSIPVLQSNPQSSVL